MSYLPVKVIKVKSKVKMVKNVDQCFPKPKMTSSNVLFYSQPKDIQFTVTKEQRNQKIFTFKKMI